MIQRIKDQRLVVFAFLIICAYLSPLFILQENAHIRVHDNLDSNLAWYKILTNSGKMFSSTHAVIPQIINGLSRNAFGTEYSGIVWLYALFPTMTAYAISQGITRVVAFFGMNFLLNTHLLQGEKWQFYQIGVSLAFALTPFWPSGMLSTLGMPLALWAFLNIHKHNGSLKDYLTLTLLPFYSSFVLGFFFFLTAMGIFWFLDFVRKRKVNFPFLLSILHMTSIYLFIEYRLVYSFLFVSEPNSRDEYFHTYLSFSQTIRLAVKNFCLGHTHDMTIHGLLILPITFIALYFVWMKRLWREEQVFVFLFTLNIFLSFWYAFWFYKGWLPITKQFHFFNTFNFARFHFLRPFIIYAEFALALKIISTHKEGLVQLTKWIVVLQLAVLCLFNEEILYHQKPTVKEFYAERLFHEIKEYIGLPQKEYRVASIGLHPAIAQYNGFYTLDTYNNFYPLKYKHQFRKIIEVELAKNKIIRTYFDQWGGRCYLFTSQLGKHYMVKKDSKRHLKNLQLHIDGFKRMGGKFIFSAIPIDNAEQNKLLFQRTFHSKDAAWKIYLYKVM